MVFVNSLNPVIFSVGPVMIKWYGLFFALGFLSSYFFVRSRIKKGILSINSDDLDLFMIWLVVGIVSGARIAFVIFYDISSYLSNPLEIFAVWHGGLSFHGGLAGALIVGFIFCHRKNIDFLHFSDQWIIPAGFALGLGRIANFINGELYGRPTFLSWGVVFSGVDGARHPSQLYESAKNFFIFGLLFWKKDAHWPVGLRTGLFLVLYGFFRFSIEFVRQPEIVLAGLTMGQWLSLPVFLVGAWMVWKRVSVV
ncbi:prolipoprotein diacylglyceryl transferase [Candidatus Woesearchaeota archaeon]|nr:prolipoprotein diacylglyceryl transferase [Candidatus Woesearchaeota archaeon]